MLHHCDPAELTNWFPDHAILEPRIEGKVRFSFYKEKSAVEHQRGLLQEGTIKEFVPGKKLSYTWQFKDTQEFPESIVTWELEEIDHNKTKVMLIQIILSQSQERLLPYCLALPPFPKN